MRRSRHCFPSPEILFRYLSNSSSCSIFLQTWEISSCTSHAPGWPACQAFLQPPWRASTAVESPTLCLPAGRPTWWGHWQRMKLTDCGTVNSPFPMFSKSLKMVSPSNGYSPVVKLYKVTPLKISFRLQTNSLWGNHKPGPDIYLEAWECLLAVGDLRRLKSRGSLCEQTIERLLDSDEKWFELRWGLIWKGLFLRILETWLVAIVSSFANISSCSQTCQLSIGW